VLELRDLARRYGDVVALDGISFTVAAGQMFGFVGPNGAGKTTTMRIVLGVLAADRGEVRFGGARVDFATRARFGYMPEERGLYPKMRVRAQLVYLAQLHGVEAGAATRAADRWIEQLGLSERAGDRVEQLSLGNQQRVQLAAALVHDPRAARARRAVLRARPGRRGRAQRRARRLRRDRRAGRVLLTPARARRALCEAVAIIKDGRLVASGPVEELRDRDTDQRHVRVVVQGVEGDDWLARVPGATLKDRGPNGALVELADATPEAVLDAARAAGTVTYLSLERPTLSDLFREAVAA
jgi:ABC-2 type transport system ATP-binding protein